LVCLRSSGILANDVRGLELTVLHRLEHLAEVVALFGRKRRAAPSARELGVDARILEVLETREPRWNRAHVAPTLDVVLPAKGIQAAAVAPDLAGEEGQVDEREDVVGRVVMLGDAEGPADHAAVGARVPERDLPDRGGRYPRLAFGSLHGIGLHGARVLVVARRGASDEFGVGEARVNDLARHRVGERDIAAEVEAKPNIGPLRRTSATRVHGDQARTVVNSTQQVVEEDRVRLTSVRAPEDHAIGLFNLAIRRSSSSGSEHCRQTGDAWSVSSPITAVDVVAAHDRARELLRNEVHLIRRLGAAEHPKAVRSESPGRLEPGGGSREGLVPRRGAETASVPYQGLGQALEGGPASSRNVRLPARHGGRPRLSVAGWERHDLFASMKALI